MTITRSDFLKLGLGAAAGLALGTAPRSATATAKEWKVIRVATEGAFPPYNMHAPDGRLIGFEPELLQELSTRMNVKCEMIAQAWDGMIAGLTDGKYDAIMDALSITPKREEVIASLPTLRCGGLGLRDHEGRQHQDAAGYGKPASR